MGLIKDFQRWTKTGTTLNDLLKKYPYLAGKEGLAPDWKIKGKGLGEIYTPEAYKEGGKIIRETLLSRGSALAEGLFSIGKEKTTDNEHWSDPYNPFKWADDQKKDFINYFLEKESEYKEDLTNVYESTKDKLVMPEINLPDINIPEFDLSGLASLLGQGIGGAITPDSKAIGKGIGSALGVPEDLDIPPVVMIGGAGVLAFIAYKVLKGDK